MISIPNERRVVVTGVGLISPLGSSIDALWDGLASEQSGVSSAKDFSKDSRFPAFFASADQFTGHIDDFGELQKDQKKLIRKGLKLMCRETKMGVAVAQRALQDAGILPETYAPQQSGCVFGSDYMLTMPEDFAAGVEACTDENGQFEYARWGSEGMPKVTPLWLLKYLPNMPASHIAIYNDLRGPSNSLTLREAASNMAIGEAFFAIARGSADMMVAGATGTRIHPMNAIHAVQQEEVAHGAMAPESASRPFDRDRSGMVLGEGAGAVVLEELQSACARGATIYGEVLARGSSAVASVEGVADRAQSLENVLRKSLRDADLEPSDIGHVHAHGLSTRGSDREEARAIAAVFGRDAACPVTAAKSYFGNLGAGSGAVELIASLLALRHQVLFPLLNFETPDSECPITPATSTSAPGTSFVTLSCTPQGQSAALIVQAVP